MESKIVLNSVNLFHTVNALHREISAIADAAFAQLSLTPSDAYLMVCVNQKPDISPLKSATRYCWHPQRLPGWLKNWKSGG